jgi:type I restriction enzyme R subunit
MRPIFSTTEYVQIKGRGTRLFTFRIGNTEYEKKNFFILDFCGVAEYFEDKYDYSVPLKLPQAKKEPKPYPLGGAKPGFIQGVTDSQPESQAPSHEIPVWEGRDIMVSREVIEVGPDGEKVDVMTFRGSFERDVKDFTGQDMEMKTAVEEEDDDTVEIIVNERFFHRPKMFYSQDKLVASYGVPAPTPAFIYNAVGKRPLPTKDEIISDVVDSIAARFNLRYNEQKWLDATTQLLVENSDALRRFMSGDMTIFTSSQFNQLGGIAALAQFEGREQVFEALRQSTLVRQTLLGASTQ